MKGIFVTGTDTGVGKTVVSAVLMNSLRPYKDVCYWKPVQTGIEDDNDTEMVRDLASCSDDEIFDHGTRLERPLSPHLSARLARVGISIEGILASFAGRPDNKFWIVEGAGGANVPLNDDQLMIDLIEAMSIPTLIVSRSGLGTINHTLLTIDALRARNIDIVGVVMNGEPNRENRKAIEHYGRVKVFAEIPFFEQLSATSITDVKIEI